MGRHFAALICCSLLGLAADARAQADYAHTGPYIGLGVTGSVFENNAADGGAGFTGHLGWRVHSHVALDALGEYFPDTDGLDEVWGGFGQLRIFALTGRIQPYVQAGIGAAGHESAGGDEGKVGFAGRVGGGVDFYLTENILVGFDFARNLPGNDENRRLKYWSLSGVLQYRF